MLVFSLTAENELYENYEKVDKALYTTRDGLANFVETSVKAFQKQVLDQIRLQNNLYPNTVCISCTTHNVLPCPTKGVCYKTKQICKFHDRKIPVKKPKRCPNGLCNDIYDKIKKFHRFNGPCWKNTDATKWCDGVNPWEIAKCFMPPSYNTKLCVADTDLTGILNVIINLKFFNTLVTENLNNDGNVFCLVRDIRNTISHLNPREVTEAKMVEYIDKMIRAMTCVKQLVADPTALQAIRELTKLKTWRLDISLREPTQPWSSWIPEWISYIWSFVCDLLPRIMISS